MILLKWIYGTRHLAVAISDRLFKQGGGGGGGAGGQQGMGCGIRHRTVKRHARKMKE